MLKNYLKISARNLYKYKGFSLINISGLAIGMTCAILILLYVRFELSFDTFHEQAGRIQRVYWQSENSQTRTPHPMAQAMVRDFPEVIEAVSLSPIWGPGLTRPMRTVKYGDKRFDEAGIFMADSTFFKVFSFKLLEGDARTALLEHGGVLITQETAYKYFGDEPALGKVLTFDFGQDFDLKVTGVMQNIPQNAHFRFDFLFSYVTLKPFETGEFFEWADFGHFNYVKLSEATDANGVEEKLMPWAAGYLDWSDERLGFLADRDVRFRLQPIEDIHLHSHLKWELESNGDIAYVYLFSTAAILILLIASINFMNLATARSANRVREVGVRKVVGAVRGQLVGQFLGEALMITAAATLISVALLETVLPYFNELAGCELSIDYSPGGWLLWALVALTLLVGLVAGSYPALFLSKFRPVQVLKGDVTSNASGLASVRKSLVFVQFVISISLLAATGIVSEQLDFLRAQGLGFEKDQLVVIPMKSSGLRDQTESIKAELLQEPGVVAATAVSNVPGSKFNQNPVRWAPDDESVSVSEMRVDYDFFETLGIAVVAGRAFSRQHGSDQEQAFILNETAARQFTWDSALDQELVWFDDELTLKGRVIGVVRDFHFQSLHRAIEPLIFQVRPAEFNYMLVKLGAETIPAALAAVESVWHTFDPEHTFEYSFLNDDFGRLYRSEERMQAFFVYFSALTVFVACLGLYGLVAFTAQQRIKEIGVRRVLGASVAGIVGLLSRDYVRLVLAANLIAWPVSFLTMNSWLQEFAYHTSPGWRTFAVATLLAMGIALLTVTTQAICAAQTNPAEALRYE